MKLILPITLTLFSITLFFAKANIKDLSVYTRQDPLKESIERGAEVYMDYCIQCHLGKGEGVPGTFPPLAGSDWLTQQRYKEAIKVIKYGQQGEIQVNGVTYNGLMANLELYDDEVADVTNYIMNNWGNTQENMVTEDEVSSITQ